MNERGIVKLSSNYVMTSFRHRSTTTSVFDWGLGRYPIKVLSSNGST